MKKIQSKGFASSLRLRRLFLHTVALGAAICLMPAMAAAPVAEKPSQPKLVVVVVIDGLPQEQVTRYRDQFGQGGFRRLIDQGAWFGNAHQAHGVTVTAVGHAAILTGAYPYQHGIIGNNWTDPSTLASVYCMEDSAHKYIGEETKDSDGTSPNKLKVTTLGDELRYATGDRSKVIAVSGKDRGAILLAGKTGTAYMFMSKTGNFASSTYYMQNHPEWVQRYNDAKPQDRYYGKLWKPLLADTAYVNDASDDIVAPKTGKNNRFPFQMFSESGNLDEGYYNNLRATPFLDELTLDFARATIENEKLGQNAVGVTDILGVSLSGHDYVNHAYGPESRASHDHLQRVDRMLGDFFTYIDKRIGLDNTIIILTADHGFPNTPEFAKTKQLNAERIDGAKMFAALNTHLAEKFKTEKLALNWSAPNIILDSKLIEQRGLKRDEVENVAARFLLSYAGVADVYTRTQLENGAVPNNHISKLMQRAWHRQVSGDLMVVPKPFSFFSYGATGTTHGSPYSYDTNVPLLVMGKHWIKPGAYGQYVEIADIAPSLAYLLRIRPPAAAEGRVLTEVLR